MESQGLIISDEEYLPLPSHIHPTPASKWTHPVSPLSLCDPTLQLTPEKGRRTQSELGKYLGGKERTTNGLGEQRDVHKLSEQRVKEHGVGRENENSVFWREKVDNIKTKEESKKKFYESASQPVVQRHFSKDAPLVRCLVSQEKGKETGDKTKSSKGTEQKIKPVLSKNKSIPPASRRSGEKNKTKKHVRLQESHQPLATPQIHSTAVLGVRLQELEREEFDAKAALMKSLAESEDMRTKFAEHVAEGVNLPWAARKYSGLVSVDICEEETLHRAVEDRLAKYKTKRKKQREKTQDTSVPAPDVLDILTPDMVAEHPTIDMSQLILSEAKLEPLPMDKVFDLYRRIQSWET